MIYFSPHKEGCVDKIKIPPRLFACYLSLIAHHVLTPVIFIIYFIETISSPT